jgi:uncharacterized protein YndB with AHSA1/START domain
MMIIVGVVALVAAAAAAAGIIGARLPRAHRAAGERTFAVAPDVLWRTLTDVDRFPSWRPDVRRVRRLPDGNGRPRWVEEGRSGKMTFAFERMDAPRVLVSRIADRGLPFGGTWTFEITPIPTGSTLRITEDGEIYNPLFRFMARYIFGYQRTVDAYLSALEKFCHGV